MQKAWPMPRIIPTPTAALPQKGSLSLWHTAHQATPWTRMHFSTTSGVGLPSIVSGGYPDKRKWEIRGERGRTLLQACSLFFLGSGQRRYSTWAWLYSQPPTQPAWYSTSQNSGYQHGKWHQTWLVHSASLGHGMSSLDFGWAITQQGHLHITPYTDVAGISGVLHLVWPLAQSLSSMVVPTRSQNSSWHSLWDLRGTQAPQLRQSNNTFGGRRHLQNVSWASETLKRCMEIVVLDVIYGFRMSCEKWSNAYTLVTNCLCTHSSVMLVFMSPHATQLGK